ncbi:MAG: hypothetical protein N3I86_00505 [Verrucomicrobiae bacterium]|nr:hypothetical protein [Verrucomicrobiae bacterium]MDW8308077.1 hypothetical protein [Verrucomicrobiales bacterium]
MSVVTVRGHYDGKHVCLDEPVDLPPNTPVWVVVAQPGQERELEELYELGRQSLARACDEDEPDFPKHVGRIPPE